MAVRPDVRARVVRGGSDGRLGDNQPKLLVGGDLWVNVRTRGEKQPTPQGYNDGKLEVELLDSRGQPIKGFTREDCTPVRGDHQEVQVKWKGGDVAPEGGRQARFYLKRVFLYGFEFRGLKGDPADQRAAVDQIELRPYEWGGPYVEHRVKYACRHDDGLCAEVRVPWFEPGERLILRTSEIVGHGEAYFYDDHFPTQEQNGRGRGYEHIAFQWNTDKVPEELSADCEVPGQGRFALQLKTGEDFIDVELTFRNDSDRALPWFGWYFCPVAFEAPSLLNRGLDRTYIFDGERLVSLAETVNPSETMFPVAGERGSSEFIPPLHASNPRSAVEAQSPLVIVENQRRTHAMGIAFERAHSIFSSVGNGCYHADPFFGHDLKSGEERTIRGRLYLAKGSAADVLERFNKDFPPEK